MKHSKTGGAAHASWVLAMVSAGGLLAACATPKVSSETWLPPMHDAPGKYRRVAVLPMAGNFSDQAFLRFESALTTAKNMDGSNYFQVADRSHMQAAVNELHLQKTSGLIDSRQVADFGRFVGAEAVYTANIVVPEVARQTSTEQHSSCPPNGGKCAMINVSCTTKLASYEIYPRLVSVATSQIVFNQRMVGHYSSKSCSDTGGEEVDSVVRGAAMEDAFEQFRKHIAPYKTTVTVPIKDDRAGLSESDKERFSGAVAFARAGRLDRACEIWNQLGTANQASQALKYDMAVCMEISGRLEEALKAYDDIDKALIRPDADINLALQRVRSTIANRAALQRDRPGTAPTPTQPTNRTVPAMPAKTVTSKG